MIKIKIKNKSPLQLNEEITLPPRDFTAFFRALKKKLMPLEDYYLKLKEIDRKYNKEYTINGSKQNAMEYFDIHGSEWQDFMRTVNKLGPKYREKSIISENLLSFEEGIKWSKSSTSSWEYLRWIESSATSFQYLIEDIQKAKLHKYSDNYGWEGWLETKDEYVEDGIPFPTREEIDLIYNYNNILLKYIPIIENAIKRLNRISEQAKGLHGDQNNWMPPEIGEVETLYHASINALPLAQSGFSLDVPETAGIGGSQSDKSGKPSISFTSDLYVAIQIARALKESVMIAKGKITFADILGWSEKEKIKDKVLDTYRVIQGRMKKSPSVLDTFNLYRFYLAHSNRYDPKFFNITLPVIRKWIRVKESDIGVIEAKVDMTNPNISYLASMQEYRIPPESVVGITRVIK